MSKSKKSKRQKDGESKSEEERQQFLLEPAKAKDDDTPIMDTTENNQTCTIQSKTKYNIIILSGLLLFIIIFILSVCVYIFFDIYYVFNFWLILVRTPIKITSNIIYLT